MNKVNLNSIYRTRFWISSKKRNLAGGLLKTKLQKRPVGSQQAIWLSKRLTLESQKFQIEPLLENLGREHWVIHLEITQEHLGICGIISEVAFWWDIPSHEKKSPSLENPGDKKSPGFGKFLGIFDWGHYG